MTEEQVKAALTEVRKSYRLLHEFQRSALDTVKYIGNRLGLNYMGSEHWFTDSSSPTGKGNLSKSAWDWLPMVLYCFNFQKDDDGGEKFRFSIFLFSDTGFFVSDSALSDKTDVDSFAPPESSGTKLGFLFFYDWPKGFFLEREEIAEFIKNDGSLPSRFDGAMVIGTISDFHKFSDEESALVEIMKIVNIGKEKGFPLEPVSRN